MFKLFACIQNENMKIYHRVSSRIMIGLVVLIVVVNAFLHQHVLSTQSMWEFIYENAGFLTMFITLFTIIVAAGSVAGEFTKGTIKLLLIRPLSRSKILLSKYIASLLFSLGMILITFVLSIVLGGFFFGFEAASQANLTRMDGSVVEHTLTYMLIIIALASVDMLMMVTFAFMISTVFRSSAMAIGFSIFLMFVGQNLLLALHQYDWVKYVLFANLNLRQHLDGMPIIEGLTMTFSITTLAVYFLIFIVLTWWIFNKRDVAV